MEFSAMIFSTYSHLGGKIIHRHTHLNTHTEGKREIAFVVKY